VQAGAGDELGDVVVELARDAAAQGGGLGLAG
jgi:hypothetical protein